jgi:glucose-1-phosphate thymidylyltransferase
MIYFPLTTIILAGITEVLIISKPEDQSLFINLLGDGSQFGIQITYQAQEAPRGLADALIIGENFLSGMPCCLILGDNLIHGAGVGRNFANNPTEVGALITATKTSNPSQFGVVKFDNEDRIEQLIEKPIEWVSDWAIPGIYFYDGTASSRARALKPSLRGEIEITDLHKSYLLDRQLACTKLSLGTVWLDMGTVEGLFEASSWVRATEKQTGFVIGSPEYASMVMGNVSSETVLARIESENSGYFDSLRYCLQHELNIESK